MTCTPPIIREKCDDEQNNTVAIVRQGPRSVGRHEPLHFLCPVLHEHDAILRAAAPLYGPAGAKLLLGSDTGIQDLPFGRLLAVSGRYYYLVDSVLGVLVGIAAWALVF